MMYRLILLAALLPATAHAQQPWGRPYTPPPPPAYTRGALPWWVPQTLPPGSPSLMIPNPPAPPYQPQPWTGGRP